LISGCFEIEQLQRLSNLNQVQDLAWQKSGLIGLTKSIKTGKSTSKIQLLVDLMHVKAGEPGRYLLFRVGRGF